jgi:hypothetical protein
MNQSTRHIMMMEPINFHSNAETMATNTYQHPDPNDIHSVQNMAVREFRAFRDTLVERGIMVTTMIGQHGSPDDIFCNNWVATFHGGELVYYPMLAPNRQRERRPEIMQILEQTYNVTLDLSAHERDGKFLESTGSHWCDRVNKIAYAGLSARTNPELLKIWANKMRYELVMFETKNHAGIPVYHTDVLMYIGSGYAGVCLDCILPSYRDTVIAKLSKTHEIIDLSMDQLKSFCGNSLELRGTNNQKFLVMSSGAHNALRDDQKTKLLNYVDEIVHSDITTIETYGGGSARCMLLELF